MEEAFLSRLSPAALEAYRERARANGRTLEEELQAILEAAAPRPAKDCAMLLRISDEALALVPPDGPPMGSDSTLLIRWDRDTQWGKWVDDGWDDARR
jgi:hypothetical protein